MRLDGSGLLIGRSLGLGLAEFGHQGGGTAFEAALETTSNTGMDKLGQLSGRIRTHGANKRGMELGYLFGRFVEEVFEVNASVRELAELALLLELSSVLGLCVVCHICNKPSRNDGVEDGKRRTSAGGDERAGGESSRSAFCW
jgi:hypothetical protein